MTGGRDHLVGAPEQPEDLLRRQRLYTDDAPAADAAH